MYGWIWRRLPFGLPGKVVGSTLLVVATVAVLWLWVFPAVEPLLPFDDVQVGTDQPAVGDDTSSDDASSDNPVPSTATPTPTGSPARSTPASSSHTTPHHQT